MNYQKRSNQLAGDAMADEPGPQAPPQESADVPQTPEPLNSSLTESLQLKKIDGHECTDSWQLLWRGNNSF